MWISNLAFMYLMQITKVGLKHNLSSAQTRFHDVNFLWWTSIHFYTLGRKVFLFGRSVNKSKAFFQPITNSKNTVVWVSSTNFPNQLKYQKMLLWSKMGVVFQHKISTTDGLWVLLKVFFVWIELKVLSTNLKMKMPLLVCVSVFVIVWTLSRAFLHFTLTLILSGGTATQLYSTITSSTRILLQYWSNTGVFMKYYWSTTLVQRTAAQPLIYRWVGQR